MKPEGVERVGTARCGECRKRRVTYQLSVQEAIQMTTALVGGPCMMENLCAKCLTKLRIQVAGL